LNDGTDVALFETFGTTMLLYLILRNYEGLEGVVATRKKEGGDWLSVTLSSGNRQEGGLVSDFTP
jgi:hypothetical protein